MAVRHPLKRGAIAIPDYKYKTVTLQRTSTITLADDPDLSGWRLKAGSAYAIEGLLQADAASSTPDFKCRFTLSQTAVTSLAVYYTVDTGGVVAETHTLQATSTFILSLSSGDRGIFIKGHVLTHATVETIAAFQWAQNEANAGDSSLIRGSWIKFTRMGKS